jgi:hypothetical protein
MSIPKFDIFAGRPNESDVAWIETVEGLGAACERMKALAARKPGPYFVFHALSHQVLGAVDTSRKSSSEVA